MVVYWKLPVHKSKVHKNMSPLVVRITDEFNTVWSVDAANTAEALQIVRDWLVNRDETPIYEIAIEINES